MPTTWLVTLVLWLVKSFGLPFAETELTALAKRFPQYYVFFKDVLLFLKALESNPNAAPPLALSKAMDAHGAACEGVGCPADLKTDA